MAKKATEDVEVKKTKKTEEEYYSEKVPVFIPIGDANRDEGELTVGHNGTIYKIKKGMEVMVPRFIAEIIRNSNAQAVAMREYSESVKDQEL